MSNLQETNEIIKALKETGVLLGVSALSSIVFGLILGIVVFVSKKDSIKPNRIINVLGNGYINIVRSFPFLIFVVALIPITRLIIGYSIGTWAATFPLSLVGIALYARFVENALDEVPHEIIDSGLSMGATHKQLIINFILVEARYSLITGFTSVLISLVSYSSVMGVVGGGGIGDFAMRYGYQTFNYPLMYSVVLIMIILVLLIQKLGNYLANKYDHR